MSCIVFPSQSIQIFLQIALHQVLGNGLVQFLTGVIGCLLHIVQALLHQCLRRNAFPFAIKMAEGIAHGLEKAENIVMISTHTGQVIERAHAAVCPKMVGNLTALGPVLNIPLQLVNPVLELWMVCQKDGAQTGQSFGINIGLFHQNPPDSFNAPS